MFLCMIAALVVGGAVGWSARGYYEEDNTKPSLEKEANILLLENNLKEMMKFTKKFSRELQKNTYDKLYNKIQELLADQIINEDEHHLKVRISTLEDKEIELKKLQAESFIETLKTIKKMCK